MARTRKARGRDVHGVVLLDKPVGITSNEALQRVKALYQARKAGHTGSLDALASGLLPICLGEATKLSGYLLAADKSYRAVCRLGIVTDTGDATGEVISRQDVPELTAAAIEAVLSEFRGEISQIPPMHSALKHKGQRLYQLAYQGIEVGREPRRVTVHELRLLASSAGEFEIKVRCSKGTYIRTLAEDIGQRLGCGAHVSALRRLQVGPFGEGRMVTLEELERAVRTEPAALDRYLLAMDEVLVNLPGVELSESLAYYLRQGQPVIVPHSPTEGLVRIYDHDHLFLGVGEVLDDGRIAPRRLVAVRK